MRFEAEHAALKAFLAWFEEALRLAAKFRECGANLPAPLERVVGKRHPEADGIVAQVEAGKRPAARRARA